MSVTGFQLTYVVGGTEDDMALERLVAAFERAGDELGDFGKYLWPRLTPLLEETIARQFDSEGDGPSGHWAPLSAQYAAWKQKKYPGAPILVATGALREGLTSSGSPFAKRVPNGDEYVYGTTGVTYASYHQVGTGKMQARQPLDLGPSFETEMTRIAAQAAREAMQQARVDEFMDLSALEHAS